MRNYRFLALLAALFIGVTASAQTQAQVDSTLLGVDILSLINQNGSANGTAFVNQSLEIRNALSRHIVANSSTKLRMSCIRMYLEPPYLRHPMQLTSIPPS